MSGIIRIQDVSVVLPTHMVTALQHWARRYCDGRMTYVVKEFNAITRALKAAGVPLESPDGTIWARDGMGRAYDGLSPEEASEGILLRGQSRS